MRKILGLTVVITGAAALAVVAGGPAIAAPQPSSVRCVEPTQITIRSLTFDPAVTSPGQTVTATVVARNCTSQTVRASLRWTLRFVGDTPGVPAGCPVVDPLPVTVGFPPERSVSSSIDALVLPSCTARTLEVTARYTDSGGALLDERTRRVLIVPAG